MNNILTLLKPFISDDNNVLDKPQQENLFSEYCVVDQGLSVNYIIFMDLKRVEYRVQSVFYSLSVYKTDDIIMDSPLIINVVLQYQCEILRNSNLNICSFSKGGFRHFILDTMGTVSVVAAKFITDERDIEKNFMNISWKLQLMKISEYQIKLFTTVAQTDMQTYQIF